MQKAPQLTVYKASAGSGKTWRLTVEYLKLLVMQPDAYRHILAVTFTNKAAGEMKERVLQALCRISRGEDAKGMDKAIVDETGLPIEKVREQATTALHLLLHDYGRFHIETIDSFFQLVLRNLARELGLGSSFNIDLDTKSVLDKAVGQLYEHASENPSVLEWIENFIEEQLRDGKSRNVAEALKTFGQNIFKECFQQQWGNLSKELSDKDFLKLYKETLHKMAAAGEKAIQDKAKEFNYIITAAGLTVDDFAYKSTGPAGYFVKLQNGNYSPDNYNSSRVRAALDNPAAWASAKSPYRLKIEQLGREKLNDLLEECEKIRQANYKTIISVRLTLAHLYKVGLLGDITAETQALNREENRFLLSDTGALLSGMIDGGDAPFIFEKIGVELEHIMIDEFQDTSHTQWNNFKPLLEEGLSNGHDSLIVGDEKQSIYRFRNGDWRILGGIASDLPTVRKVLKELGKNYRSEHEIVEFNNDFFKKAISALKNGFKDVVGEPLIDSLEVAYGSIEQKCTKKDDNGWVEVSFLGGKDDYNDSTLRKLVEYTEKLQHQGIAPEQMAILVRKNKDIPTIANYFASYRQNKGIMPTSPDNGEDTPAKITYDPSLCYEIVSDEAFLLGSSVGLRLVMAALRVVLNPSDGIAMEELLQQHILASQLTATLHPLPADLTEQLSALRQLPLTEIVDSICNILDISSIDGQGSYLFSFLDHLNDFVSNTSSDMGEFISYWDETLSGKAIPMGAKLHGIRILSIHKSKGLEYHTVIVPFANWKLLNETNSETVWCTPSEAPYDKLSLCPIDYKSDMAGSIYEKEYREESLQLLIDSLNALYVAFTRASKNLIVLSRYNGDEKMASVANLLFEVLSKTDGFDGDSLCYTKGTMCTLKEEDDFTGNNIPVSFTTYSHKAGFRQSNRAKEFLRQVSDDDAELSMEDYTNSFIEHGKLMHHIFEQILHLEDVDTAIATAVGEGLLSAEEAPATKSFVEKALSDPSARIWWEGDYQLYNECSIIFLDENGELTEKRPDRVVRRGDSIEVIDYKFGKSARKHYTQVQQYMTLLSGMGFKQIKGWLWYVEANEVIPVTL